MDRFVQNMLVRARTNCSHYDSITRDASLASHLLLDASPSTGCSQP